MNAQECLDRAWSGWRIGRAVGSGSYGTVYEIVRTDGGQFKSAALKVVTIPRDPTEVTQLRSEGYTEREATDYLRTLVDGFLDEIRVMNQLRGNVNVVEIEDYRVLEHEDGVGWDILIRMELLRDLNALTAQRDLTEPEILRVGCDLCQGLTACRSRNIVHRDIKPENIFVSRRGDFKLGDFGVARRLESMTLGFSRKGTYFYMAPEIYNDDMKRTDIDDAVRVDIYSLGMVLYRLANARALPFFPSDRPPTPTERSQAVVRRMRGEALPRPQRCSDALADVILKACSFDPAGRYASAEEMKAALLDVARREGIRVYPRPAYVRAPGTAGTGAASNLSMGRAEDAYPVRSDPNPGVPRHGAPAEAAMSRRARRLAAQAQSAAYADASEDASGREMAFSGDLHDRSTVLPGADFIREGQSPQAVAGPVRRANPGRAPAQVQPDAGYSGQAQDPDADETVRASATGWTPQGVALTAVPGMPSDAQNHSAYRQGASPQGAQNRTDFRRSHPDTDATIRVRQGAQAAPSQGVRRQPDYRTGPDADATIRVRQGAQAASPQPAAVTPQGVQNRSDSGADGTIRVRQGAPTASPPPAVAVDASARAAEQARRERRATALWVTAIVVCLAGVAAYALFAAGIIGF